MASNTHVDSRVQERRLRPIYDWLDSGNNKKALQEAEKVLKKQPNFLCAKVLKALALQRLGKEAECEEILEGVCQQVPTDEATLQAMAICYRAVHKTYKICDIYSAASKKDPNNEELLTHLFMSYVRIGDYRKQHQHAMSLYKLRKKNPYYFWAVMSVVMQAKGDESIGQTVALKLAEKMVSKFVSEGKIEAEQEVQLYLMILEMQGKYEEALDIIEGELGGKLKSFVTTAMKRIDLLIKLERWKEANVLLKCQLEKNRDSWSDYKNYLKTVLMLYDEYQKMKGDNVESNNTFENRVPIRVPISNNGKGYILWYDADYTPEMVLAFLNQLIKNAEENKKSIRGPYLAQLELYKLLTNESLNAETVVGNITDLLVNYFAKFGEKPICVSDLKSYLPLLNDDEKLTFKKRISEIVGLEDGEPAPNVSTLQKHISLLQLNRLLGFHKVFSTGEKLQFCNSLISHYESSKKLVSPDKLPTEFSCNDPYVILLSHVLFSLYQETKSRSHIMRAVYHLEKALALSPSNFHFKLLLVKFYILLGSGQQAHHFYEQLETKYIQLDSMGYLFGTSGYGLGSFSATVALYDATLKFFFSNTDDSVDHLTYAYKYGSFMKIQEFVEFRDRLNDSLHYTFCTVEKMIHDLLWTSDFAQSKMVVKSMDISPGHQKIAWTQLRDNRDLNVIVSYESGDDQLNDRTVAKTFENVKSYVKLRDGILKCLCAIFDFVSDDQTTVTTTTRKGDEGMANGDSESLRVVLTKLVSEMNSTYEELRSQDLDVQNVINTPPPCRLKSFLQVPVCKVITDMVEMILLTDESSVPDDKLTRCAKSVSDAVKSSAAPYLAEGTDTGHPSLTADSLQSPEVLGQLVAVCETVAVAVILTGCLKASVQRVRKGPRKGKKKKEEDGGNESCTYRNLLKDLSDCISRLDGALGDVSEKVSEKIVADEVQALNLDTCTDPIAGVQIKLCKSVAASVQEMRNFLQEKQFYINTLKS